MIDFNLNTDQTQYFAISDSFDCKKILSLQRVQNLNFEPKYLIKKYNIGSTKSYFNSGYFHHSEYDFFNKKNEPTYIEENGWKLNWFSEQKDRKRIVNFQISDPLNYTKSFDNKYNRPDGGDAEGWTMWWGMYGIIRIIKFISELSSNYKTWREYDLNKTIEQLENQLETLTKENELLTKKYEVFVKEKKAIKNLYESLFQEETEQKIESLLKNDNLSVDQLSSIFELSKKEIKGIKKKRKTNDE